MQTRLIRIEQKQANPEEVDQRVNQEIKQLESKGHQIQDIRIAVGRDADKNSGIEYRYSITVLLMYK